MAGVFFAVVGVVTNKPRASAISGISDAVCLISALVGVVTNKPRTSAISGISDAVLPHYLQLFFTRGQDNRDITICW
jgi:hypothetical protein